MHCIDGLQWAFRFHSMTDTSHGEGANAKNKRPPYIYKDLVQSKYCCSKFFVQRQFVVFQ
jgi:hypothetical protein